MDFVSFPKIPRLSREIVITEKIDGTNGVIYIPSDNLSEGFFVGSRSRWITPSSWLQKDEEEFREMAKNYFSGQ